ncbi:MAG: hypothetical protein ACP5I8_13640, partial [Phycisphaerae bacterium]
SGCWTDALYRGWPLGHLPEHVLGLWHFGRFDVSAILPLANGQTLVGHYGVGVSVAHFVSPSPWSRMAVAVKGWAERLLPSLWHAGLPEPAKAPTSRQLAALYHNLLKKNIPPESAGSQVIPITDDWRTQGTWLGRYGRSWACLFAFRPSRVNFDYVWAPGPLALHHTEGIGPHQLKISYGAFHPAEGDVLNLNMTWLATAKRRELELPEVYLDQCITRRTATWKADRRGSEIDDHSEVYPATWQGPDLYVYLHIPPGMYTLSLYFFNKDGHFGQNRDRDYVISMLPMPASYHFGSVFLPHTAPLAEMRGIAQSRVVNFCGGVWKRFIVRGPMKLAIRMAREYSFVTLLQAAMLDPLAEHPPPYYYGYRAWQAHQKQQSKFRTRFAAAWRTGQLSDDPPAAGKMFALAMVQRILQILNVLERRDPAAWVANQRLAYLSILRWCVARYGAIPRDRLSARIAEKCYYHLGLFHRWEAAEKLRGMLTSRQVEKGLHASGWPYSYRGHEFGVIRRYLQKMKLVSTPPNPKSSRKEISH